MGDVRSSRAWRALRAQVFLRDGEQCAECGSAGSEDNPLHIDHINPIANGGAGMDIDNCQVLCKRCNLKKGATVGPKRFNWYDRDWLDNIAR